jgi:glucose 1-dehydrogenase
LLADAEFRTSGSGGVEDVARVAVWLVSEDADYVHGASIFVDGGMTLDPGFEAGG